MCKDTGQVAGKAVVNCPPNSQNKPDKAVLYPLHATQMPPKSQVTVALWAAPSFVQPAAPKRTTLRPWGGEGREGMWNRVSVAGAFETRASWVLGFWGLGGKCCQSLGHTGPPCSSLLCRRCSIRSARAGGTPRLARAHQGFRYMTLRLVCLACDWLKPKYTP